MRRIVATVGVLVLCLGLFPARADAFFWGWLDDLSGPSFKGATFNWRVWCQTDPNANTSSQTRLRDARADQRRLDADLADFKTPGRAESALKLYDEAKKRAQQSRRAISEGESADDSSARDAKLRASALLRLQAQVLLQAALYPEKLTAQQVIEFIDLLPEHGNVETEMVAGVGVEASLCKMDPTQTTRSFLSANAGIGYNKPSGLRDGKREPADYEYAVGDEQMVTIGLSYHAVVAPYLTIGAGGGMALFSSKSLPTFKTWYVEPYILDVKPARFFFGPSILADMFAFRYNGVIFPTGFEPGRFERWTDAERTVKGPSFRLPAELVNSVGLHIDLEPLLKRAHK